MGPLYKFGHIFGIFQEDGCSLYSTYWLYDYMKKLDHSTFKLKGNIKLLWFLQENHMAFINHQLIESWGKQTPASFEVLAYKLIFSFEFTFECEHPRVYVEAVLYTFLTHKSCLLDRVM